MSQYFPKPCNYFGGNVKAELDLSSHATKTDSKKATRIDTPNLALKSNLPKLKAEVDKIDVDKLKPIPTDLRKLSNVIDDEVVKRIAYDKLAAKVNNIDT